MAVNRNSPIVPGKGAASIMLGEQVADIFHQATEGSVAEQETIRGAGDVGVIHDRSTDVDFWAKSGLIVQIIVHDGYTGRVLEK